MDKEEEMRLLKIELYKDYVNPRYHVDIITDSLDLAFELLEDSRIKNIVLITKDGV